MEIEKIKWNEENYKEFLKYSISLKDDSYKEFNSGIVNTKLEIIGIRVPIMRKIAKSILNTDIEDYIKYVGNKYYEEVFIEGLVISGSSEEILDKYLVKFIEKVDNWGICDSFCSNMKIINKKIGKYWIYFTSMIDLEKEFQTRISIVMIMNYYLCDNYIDRVLKIVSNINSDKYYINMAISWLLSVAIIKYPDRIMKLLESKKLNKFVQNKTISKIQDSYRVDKNLKELVKKYKIKNYI